MLWGPVPYTVRTNSLGFRGGEIAREKPAGVRRLAALGDSVTDGFFVDNADTWTARLQDLLNVPGEPRTEVLNAARGGGSIDKELAILRRAVLPLEPDLVILTFVTNDLDDLVGTTREEMLAFDPEREAAGGRLASRLLTGTALGEASFDLWLGLTSPSYRRGRARLGTADRYLIPGGADFAANVRDFQRRYRAVDGLALADPLPPVTARVLEDYLAVLGVMKALLDQRRTPLLLVYHPAYSQVYGPPVQSPLQERLEAECRRLGVGFADLTPDFREGGAREVLHLAPLDYHLNPAGHRLLARALARRLAPRTARSGP
jgi:lysophospholipase L1-like esterase